jgi:hypothetical protein
MERKDVLSSVARACHQKVNMERKDVLSSVARACHQKVNNGGTLTCEHSVARHRILRLKNMIMLNYFARVYGPELCTR